MSVAVLPLKVRILNQFCISSIPRLNVDLKRLRMNNDTVGKFEGQVHFLTIADRLGDIERSYDLGDTEE